MNDAPATKQDFKELERDSKACSLCKAVKPLEAFHREKRVPMGRRSRCKACEVEQFRNVRKSNPQKYRDKANEYYRNHPDQYLRRYNLSVNQRDDLLKAQHGRCASCRELIKRGHIDHCHKTGLIRGILCKNCNLAEGLLKTPAKAQFLADYMSRNELFYGNRNNNKN